MNEDPYNPSTPPQPPQAAPRQNWLLRGLLFIIKSGVRATITIIVSLTIMFIIMLYIIGNFADTTPSIENNSILHIDLTMNLVDTPPAMTLEQLLGEALGQEYIPTYSVRDLVSTIIRAKTDRRISGILISGSLQPMNYGASYPALRELKRALLDFKESEKPIYSYTLYPSARDLYIHTVADEAYINHTGSLLLPGLYSEPMFFANAMEKYGIGVQAVRVGEYKSAVEPFTRENLSDEAREAEQLLLDQLWAQLVSDIARQRELDTLELIRTLNDRPLFTADQAVELGLYDRSVTYNEMENVLNELTGEDAFGNMFKETDLLDYTLEKDLVTSPGTGPAVAVVYAEGVILNGYAEPTQAGEARIVEELRAARLNENVKAIILRVNSPGGSASASEMIQDELLSIKQQGLPVIVSMGGYAASGGYYISQTADKVYAHPHTITGSIGIYGLLFHLGEAAGKLGITFDEVKTNENSDIFSIAEPKTDEQIALIQSYLQEFYDEWMALVRTNRELGDEDIYEIAKGRVWSGVQAKTYGLVDELGDLYDAIEYAAETAGISENYVVRDYPQKQSPEDAIATALGLDVKVAQKLSALTREQQLQILSELSKTQHFSTSTTLKEQLRAIYTQLETLNQLNDPLNSYALMPFQYR